MREEAFERSVLDDQIARALFADARHALDVVDRIAHQRQDIDYLIRHDAELLLHAACVEPRAVVARVEDADAVADELEEVLVARDNGHVEPGRHRLLRQRPDYIVRLVAFGGEDRHAQGFARGMHHGNLLRQLVRHRRSIGFVVGGEVVAERPSRQIEGRCDIGGVVLVEQLAQHRDEDVHGVRRTPFRVPQQPAFGSPNRCVERPIHLRAAVDQVEEGSGGHVGAGTDRNLYYIIGGYADPCGRGRCGAGARRDRGRGLRRRGTVPAI
jgi:hypothetical protein